LLFPFFVVRLSFLLCRCCCPGLALHGRLARKRLVLLVVSLASAFAGSTRADETCFTVTQNKFYLTVCSDEMSLQHWWPKQTDNTEHMRAAAVKCVYRWLVSSGVQWCYGSALWSCSFTTCSGCNHRHFFLEVKLFYLFHSFFSLCSSRVRKNNDSSKFEAVEVPCSCVGVHINVWYECMCVRA
jgi:hypothetical protein